MVRLLTFGDVYSLGLSPFLMEKLVARLREEEVKEKEKA